MINIRTGELADILPVEFTRQPQALAISYALKQAYQTYLDYQNTVYVYVFIDNAPEYVLDFLAVELHVRYYRQDLDLETKRNLVKSAMQVALKDGTLYAVNSVINTIFGDGEAIDWYDYGGDPNHFKIDLNVDDGNYDIDELIAVVDDVKRETARLDSVTMHQDHHHENIYLGSVMVEGVSETIGCEDVPDVDIIFLGDEDDNYIADENGSYIYSWEEAES